MKIIIKNLYYFINDITKIIIEKEGINDFSQLNRRQIFAHFLKSMTLRSTVGRVLMRLLKS